MSATLPLTLGRARRAARLAAIEAARLAFRRLCRGESRDIVADRRLVRHGLNVALGR